MHMIKASTYCAFTVVVMFFLVAILRDPYPIDIDKNIVVGLLMGGGFLWTIGFVFSMILLVLLIPVFKRTSLICSFLIFIIIGFYIPAYLSYFFATVPAHGETPELYTSNNVQAILSIIYGGLVGAAGAASAWYSLKKDTVKMPNKKRHRLQVS